jgi:TP53 regulating kinase-like protein
MVVPEKGLLCMEYIEDSVSLKEALWKRLVDDHSISGKMAEIVADLHLNDMIHGDLTTSNFLLQQSSGRVFLIDFGLAGQSSSAEDKAVDLYVLERAVRATHSTDHPGLFASFAERYFARIGEQSGENACSQLQKRFEEVRARGRKRE